MMGSMVCSLLVLTMLFGCSAVLKGQAPDPLLSRSDADTAYVNLLTNSSLEAHAARPELATQYATKALGIAREIGYEKGEANALFALSKSYFLKGDYTKEMELLLQALGIYERVGDSLLLAKTYSDIGTTNFQSLNMATATEFYQKALELYTRLGNDEGIANSYRRLGNVQVEIDPKAGLDYYLKALEYERKINHLEGISSAYNNISIAYFGMDSLAQAEKYILMATDLIKQINNLVRLPAAYYNLCRIYIRQGKFDQALPLAEESLRLATQLDIKQAIAEARSALSMIYEGKQDYAKALYYHQLFAQLSDSLRVAENTTNVTRIQALYQSEQQQQQIERLQEANRMAKTRQMTILIGLVLFVLVAGTIILFQRRNIAQKKELLAQNERLLLVEQQLNKAEVERKHLAEQQYQQDLEFRHKELLTFTLHLAQKNALMEKLREGIQELVESTTKESKVKLTKLIRLIDYSLETEKDWDEFRMYFEKIHSSFFENLKEKFPDLTQSDLKLCALISLNLSMKEMAELMGISPESVKMARYRLRKKLNMENKDNLTEFLASFKTVTSSVA